LLPFRRIREVQVEKEWSTGIIISGRNGGNQRMEWIKCKIRTVFYSRGFNLFKTLQFKTSFFGMRIIPPYFSAIKIP
jgi:hypothetical protein